MPSAVRTGLRAPSAATRSGSRSRSRRSRARSWSSATTPSGPEVKLVMVVQNRTSAPASTAARWSTGSRTSWATRHGSSEGRYPHSIEWTNDARRFDPPPHSFQQVLEWLLDGLARRVADHT
jgi:hypothetical protein